MNCSSGECLVGQRSGYRKEGVQEVKGLRSQGRPPPSGARSTQPQPDGPDLWGGRDFCGSASAALVAFRVTLNGVFSSPFPVSDLRFLTRITNNQGAAKTKAQ